MKPLIFEEHSEVLAEWKRRDCRGRTLICLDAHLDLKWISPPRREALKRCVTAEELDALAKPHPLLPHGKRCFGIEDFLFAAHELGMIDRLIWVSPPQTRMYGQCDPSQLQFLEGVVSEELQNFRRDGSMIRGTLLGLPIEICDFTDLPNLQIPPDSLLDIDIDYFLAEQDRGLWVDPRSVFEQLQSVSLRTDFVSITRSVTSGFMPLKYRFVADYLAALWQGDTDQTSHFARLLQADGAFQQGDVNAAVGGCLRELEKSGHCAATHYLLSCIASESRDRAKHRVLAAERNRAYRPNSLRAASEFLSRNLDCDERQLGELEDAVRQEVPADTEELALSHVALACLYARLDDLSRFRRHVKAFRRTGVRHAKLNLEMGRLLLLAGQRNRAVSFLRAAGDDELTRSAAHALLGNTYLREENLQLAAQSFQILTQRMPAWGTPFRTLAKIYRRLGEQAKYFATLEQLKDLPAISSVPAPGFASPQ